jgi:hypothetical protein
VVDVPIACEDYNKNMNGVDTNDQRRATNTVQRRNSRWPMTVFNWVLDSAAQQAYVAQSLCGETAGSKRGPRDSWMRTLSWRLLERGGATAGRRRTVRHLPQGAAWLAENNMPTRGRYAGAGCGLVVSTYCTACRAFYCITARSCFADAHSD